jgi:fructose-1,6-bisphosphatase/inositol monophosphatase family enzyme
VGPVARNFQRGWPERLQDLCDELRGTARQALAESIRSGAFTEAPRPVRDGAGDVTFALDAATESVIDRWLDAVARREPLSLLTEDEGWRHRGPGPGGSVVELPGFDHGGPRIAIDPIDGTRHLMSDLRSAWTIVSYAPPGSAEPRLSDVSLGLVSEIPDTRAARYRRLWAERGLGARLEERLLEDGRLLDQRRLTTGQDARPDHGYFSFFRYLPAQRPALAAIEARFFERLARLEGADVRSCYDDQYICSGGQLVLLALGTYRLAADLRGWLGTRLPGIPAIATHAYDIAGAVLVAREAGVVVEAVDGAPLDFPIDCTSPVSFVAWTNRATGDRLRRHLSAALEELRIPTTGRAPGPG